MARNAINPADLGDAIAQELRMYHERVEAGVNAAGEKAVKNLVKKTKATAPEDTGEYKKRITWSARSGRLGCKRYIWHVKAPDYRLTHLLVHGHATVNGGRTAANPFLKDALNAVLPSYEKAVKEAVKGD